MFNVIHFNLFFIIFVSFIFNKQGQQSCVHAKYSLAYFGKTLMYKVFQKKTLTPAMKLAGSWRKSNNAKSLCCLMACAVHSYWGKDEVEAQCAGHLSDLEKKMQQHDF